MYRERSCEPALEASDNQVVEPVEVTLAITVMVDGEYAVEDHIKDILLSAQRLFTSANVRLV